MARVSSDEGIAYGLHLFGYVLILMLVGGSITLLAFLMFDSVVLRAVAGLVAAAVVLLGLSGMGYKIVADGVARGILLANEGDSERKSLADRIDDRSPFEDEEGIEEYH